MDTKTDTNFPLAVRIQRNGRLLAHYSLTIRERLQLSSRLREHIMKTRYRLICRNLRGGMFYCVDTQTGKRTSLQTSNEEEARQLVDSRNQAVRQPAMNLQIARSICSMAARR